MELPASPAAISRLIPHQGRMCLLDAVLQCSATHLECRASSHRAPDHPLRSASGLLAAVGIEYAAQAMALHGALNARPGVRGLSGFLASARNVRLHVVRLDEIAGDLRIRVDHLAGDARQVAYRFALHDAAGRPLLDGRAIVVLDTPLAA